MSDMTAGFDWSDGERVQLVRGRGDAGGRLPAGTDHITLIGGDEDSPALALTITEAVRLIACLRHLAGHFGNVSCDEQLSAVVGDLHLVVRVGVDCDAPHGAEKYATAATYVWLEICHQYGGTPVTWGRFGGHDAGRLADTIERFVA